jgi:hypothetical protein
MEQAHLSRPSGAKSALGACWLLVIVVTSHTTLKDIQVLERSATLKTLRKVVHCHHNNSSSHFRLVLFWHKGETLEKIVYDML